MTKLLLALSVALLASSVLLWRMNSTLQAEAVRLRLSVQALEASAARSSRASAVYRQQLTQARAAEVASAKALERALAASPEWSATQVPQEVQDAP